ncbi:MAG: hypothetical protein JSV25_02415 [Spirochaetota bacterium]|nr:MAG: hypothetical protein JSV25_02415 [Spirochaetota bacterium]
MTEKMTTRERFKKIMNFEKPDRLLWTEDPFEETIIRWIHEGLPIDQVLQTDYDIGWNGSIYQVLPMPHTLDISNYFGFIPICPPGRETIVLDLCPIPRHVPKILKETEDKILLRDPLGGKLEHRKLDYTMPHFCEFPVKSMKDWQETKKRLDPKDPRRYPKDYTREQYIELFDETTTPTSLVLSGFYAFGRGVMGTAAFTPVFYTDPDLAYDMMNFYADFLINVIREIVETLKSRIDWVYWWEDMACGTGPNISPKVFKEFILPNLKKVTGFLNKNNIDIIIMDCDGDFRPLLPLLWEGGIRGLWPLEVNAGIDAVELRKQYGKKWRLGGNIDKRVLTEGKEAIKNEIDKKIPILKEEGGYIPGLDHSIPPNVSLKNFEFYAEYLKSLLDY